MKKTNIQVVAVSTIALLATSLTSCSNNVSVIAEHIENARFEEAINLFESKKLNDKDKALLVEQLSESLRQLPIKFGNNEIDYDTANAEITTISQMYLSELDVALAKAMGEIEAVQASKKAFLNAETAYNNKDYLSAYRYCVNVIEADSNYESAQELIEKSINGYCEYLNEEIDRIISNNKYEEAFQRLEESKNTPSMDDEIVEFIEELIENTQKKYYEYLNNEVNRLTNNNKYEEAFQFLENSKNETKNNESVEYIEELINSTRRNQSMDAASDYAKSGDYGNALATIHDYLEETHVALDNDTELKKMYSEYETEYVSLIISRVATLRENEQYLQALEVLNNALQLSDSEELHEQMDQINAIRPTYLADLTISDSHRFDIISEGEQLHDTLGNIYSPNPNLYEISTRADAWVEDDVGYAAYNLNYRYTTLKGVVSVDDISSQLQGMQFEILGDDVVIYSSAVNRTSMPLQIDIDVSTVNWLKFTVVGGDDVKGSDGDAIYCIMSEFILE